jgi:hypothetical protein
VGWRLAAARRRPSLPRLRPGAGRLAGDDREHRIRAARLVLGSTPAPPWAGHRSEPAARYWHDDYLADVFAWWQETAGARPGRGAERFGYVTGPELVARLYAGREPHPPKVYSRGRRPAAQAAAQRARPGGWSRSA